MSSVIEMRGAASGIREQFDQIFALAPAIAQTTAAERIARIRRLMKVTLAHRAEIYEAVKQERGLTPPDVDGELVMLKFEADFIAKHLETWMSPKPAEPSLMTLGKKCYLRYEAKGMVLVLPSWNAPYVIGFLPVFGAIAAGNAVIVKPSELSPQSSALVAKIVAEAFPNGEVRCIEGGAEAAQALLACPFHHIFYIGNNTVGRIVMKAAADHFASVTLEMGGKNPLVILDDADIDVAVNCAVQGAYFSTGQRCTASSRLIVTEGIHNRFVEACVERMRALVVDDALKNGTHIGPVVDETQLAQDERYIALGRREGGNLRWGGDPVRRATPGYYLQPALFTDTHNGMRINREEVFGPVATVIRVRDFDEALATANDTEFGLTAGICTNSLKHARHFKRHAQAGMVMVNLPTAGVDYHVPFGGRKGSSYGPREQGSYAAEFYTTVKTTYTAG